MPLRITQSPYGERKLTTSQACSLGFWKPLASVKADLKVIMDYRLPGDHARAAIEIYFTIGLGLPLTTLAG